MTVKRFFFFFVVIYFCLKKMWKRQKLLGRFSREPFNMSIVSLSLFFFYHTHWCIIEEELLFLSKRPCRNKLLPLLLLLTYTCEWGWVGCNRGVMMTFWIWQVPLHYHHSFLLFSLCDNGLSIFILSFQLSPVKKKKPKKKESKNVFIF